MVAAELELRWNERLAEVRRWEEQLDDIDARHNPAMSPQERARFLLLGADLERAWQHPGATPETRKRLLRPLLVEIVARVEDEEIALVLHWEGGDHTRLAVRKNRTGQHRWATDASVGEMIRELARLLPDGAIAAVLNRSGKRTGRGNTWTEVRVRSWRTANGIAVYRKGERAERGEVTLDEAAGRRGVSKMTVLRLIRAGAIPARQACKGAPWVIPEGAVMASGLPERTGAPVTGNPNQKSLEF